MINYDSLMEVYFKSEYYKERGKEADYFKNMPALDEATKAAVLSKNKNNELFPHQYRIRKEAFKEVYKNIDEIISRCSKVTIFEEFLDIIEDNKVKGYGRLARVDFAFRMSAKTGIIHRHIYIQSGSYIGAKLLGLKRYRDKYGGYYIEICDIPEKFKDLDTITLENFLCWYANYDKHNLHQKTKMIIR